MRKFLKWIFFGIREKPVEKKKEVIEPIDAAMRKFMETGKNGERNWKPVGNGKLNPWNL